MTGVSDQAQRVLYLELADSDVVTVITALQLWASDESEPDRVREAARVALDNIGRQSSPARQL